MHIVSMSGPQVLFEGEIGSESEIFLEQWRSQLREKNLEEVLSFSFETLEQRGYAAPRVYISKKKDCMLLRGKDLPREMQEKKVNSPFLEEIISHNTVYVNDQCRRDPRLIIDNDPLTYIKEPGLIAAPFAIINTLKGVLVANYNKHLLPEERGLFYRVSQDLGQAMSTSMSLDLEKNRAGKEMQKTQREVERARQEIEQLKKQMADLKRRDNATGLYNKQAFHHDLQRLIPAIHQGSNYYLVLLDVDNLKKFNLQFGHTAGDEFVSFVGEYLRTIPEAAAYRAGGDKFALLTKAGGNKTDSYILKLGHNLREGVMKIPVPDGSVPLTASLSICLSNRSHLDSEDWYAVANDALMEAKKEKNKGVYLEPGRTVTSRISVNF